MAILANGGERGVLVQMRVPADEPLASDVFSVSCSKQCPLAMRELEPSRSVSIATIVTPQRGLAGIHKRTSRCHRVADATLA